MQYISYAIAILIPAIVLYVIYSLDLYQSGSMVRIGVCFVWGIAAYFLAFRVNTFFYTQGWASVPTIQRYVAPISEELLKAIILVILITRPKFTYFVDGAVYGFAAGIGFAIVENFLYLGMTPEATIGTAVGRVISANLVHATATALVGVSLGLARFQRLPGKIAYTILGLGAAISLHMLFNNVVTRDLPGPMLLYSAVIGMAGVALIAWIIFRGLAEQRKWIEEKLGMTDRVTSQEAGIVLRMEDLGELLKPLRTIFGDEKGDLVEKFLLLQAQLGIQRKALEKLPDEASRRQTQQQINQLGAQMEATRTAVGPYVMLYVRRIIPVEKISFTEILGGRIGQVAEERKARVESGGSNLDAGAILSARMARPRPVDETPAPAPTSGEAPDGAALAQPPAEPASPPPAAPAWAAKIKKKDPPPPN
jgi:RsiW-degrading membrane proteinase PrsW (M82 family)